MRQEKETGLNQKKLARRIRRKPEVINRWLSSAGNWELDTISDLLLGMDVDLDDPHLPPWKNWSAMPSRNQRGCRSTGEVDPSTPNRVARLEEFVRAPAIIAPSTVSR